MDPKVHLPLNHPSSSSSVDSILLGPVPSQAEVESAIASLQTFMHQIPKKPSNGYTRVGDAFRLLQSDPAIQKLVAALATDKAVWDAVKKNEMVQKKLQHPIPGESFKLHGCSKQGETCDSNQQANQLLAWIIDIASRITELIQKWQSLVHVVLHPLDRPPSSEQPLMDQSQTVGPPLLLAVVTLLIVVIARAQRLPCC
ncbi:hypothetical protein LINGRAHAP2_LOCUS32787 [Linum grandiflorum]